VLAFPDESYQAPFTAAVRLPDLLVGNVLDLFPGLGIVEALAPVLPRIRKPGRIRA
jgi:hypothetical protein